MFPIKQDIDLYKTVIFAYICTRMYPFGTTDTGHTLSHISQANIANKGLKMISVLNGVH